MLFVLERGLIKILYKEVLCNDKLPFKCNYYCNQPVQRSYSLKLASQFT